MCVYVVQTLLNVSSPPPRRGGGQQPVLALAPSGARGLRGALLEGLRAERLDAVVHLLPDLLQQEHRGQADEDALHPGLQRRRR